MRIPKLSLILGFIFISSSAFAQRYNDNLYHGSLDFYFFGRQPSSRIESMGKEFTSAVDEPNSYFYNPAGIASLTGLSVTGSYSQPYYLLKKASNNYFSAAYKIKNYGVIGFSRDYFTVGEDLYFSTVINPEGTGNPYRPYIQNYRLSLASEPVKGLFAGINLNLLSNHFFPYGKSNTFIADAGVIKSFSFLSGKKYSHQINIGTSVANIFSAKDHFSGESELAGVEYEEVLPVTLRLGSSYTFSSIQPWLIPNLNGFEISAHLDYRNVLNSTYLQTISAGAELLILEMIALRGGYFSEKESGNCVNCNEHLSQFTYGIGFNIPIRKLANSPTGLNVSFDLTSLEQPSYIKWFSSPNEPEPEFDNFQVYTLKLNWQF